ncbi:hypothetical protein ACQCSJ_25265, partial [Ralstonia pseudosolanacearum]
WRNVGQSERWLVLYELGGNGELLLRTVLNGQWNLAGFDLGALALAFGFVALARATWRRARHGAQASVWALPPQTARQSCGQGRDTVGQA